MAKGYWITCYRSISDADAMAEYAKLAGPAITGAGGKFLVRGPAEQAFEAGVVQRTVVIEFESVAAAVACYNGAAYAPAKAIAEKAAERDVRIAPGVA